MSEYKKGMRPPKDYIREKASIFGDNVRLQRKSRGLTADTLGKFLSISTAYVGLIERGERCPSMETFLRICDFFGASTDDMLTPAGTPTTLRDNSVVDSRQAIVNGMLDTFSKKELGHVVEMIKGFKKFTLKVDLED